MDKKQVWDLAQETMRAFMPFYQGAMRQAIQDTGAPNSWLGLRLARGSEPAPLSVEHFQALAPYTAPGRLLEMLDELAGLELLERVGEGAYRLTDPGREVVEDIYAAAHRDLETIDPLPVDEMDRLNGLLYRLVEATLEAPEPQHKWAMRYSRWTDPGQGASGSIKADQYLTDLVLYRDDAHNAAWKSYDVSGPAWEALTLIWRDEAHTVDELVENLSRRSYAVEDYEEALGDLTARGWVLEEADGYHLTEKGKQVREAAEEETDRLFYVGWSALNEKELAKLEKLLARAKENLQTTAQDQIWGLAREMSGSIYPTAQDVTRPLVEKLGLDKPGLFHALHSAHRLEPDTVSATRLGILDPYTNPARYNELLAELAEKEYLSPSGDGEYELAEKGRAAWEEIHRAFYTRLGQVAVLSEEDLAQLEGFLKQLVEASLEAQDPADKGCITGSHQGHPSQEYASLAKIDQHLDDLSGFRDDAHLAAWKPYDVSAPAWEALTFVWRGDADTPEALVEKLPFRGYSAEVYAEALTDLAGRGWVEETPEGYRVTEKGAALRQKAEDVTNRYFFAPWACLNDYERAQLHGLLTRIKGELKELVKDNQGDA